MQAYHNACLLIDLPTISSSIADLPDVLLNGIWLLQSVASAQFPWWITLPLVSTWFLGGPQPLPVPFLFLWQVQAFPEFVL